MAEVRTRAEVWDAAADVLADARRAYEDAVQQVPQPNSVVRTVDLMPHLLKHRMGERQLGLTDETARLVNQLR